MARRQPPRAPKPFDINLHVNLSGPFFEHDPAKTVKGNIELMMQGLAAEGQKIVRAGWTNSIRGRSGVVGRAYSLSGKPWTLHATITPEFVYPWPGGGDKKYRGGRNKKRTRAFRDGTYRIRSAQDVLATRLLAKGLE